MIIKDSDFVFEWFSGTGAGGQHRNKHQNCCRCIHAPTGIRANGTSSKSRETNKKNSLAMCRSRIITRYTVSKERYNASNERIRTYHEPDNRVIDHTSGQTDTYKNVVLNGNIEDMIEARKKSKII